jgi:ABC-type antimicrobial peptide transport system permease subunit
MATFDRIREFGILKALGATPMRILVDIISEAFLMGFLATLLGVLIGISGTMYLQTHGIDTSGLGTDISWAGIAFDPIWKAKLTWDAVSRPVVMMWIVSVVSALYPAIIAARLKPVEAMHHV